MKKLFLLLLLSICFISLDVEATKRRISVLFVHYSVGTQIVDGYCWGDIHRRNITERLDTTTIVVGADTADIVFRSYRMNNDGSNPLSDTLPGLVDNGCAFDRFSGFSYDLLMNGNRTRIWNNSNGFVGDEAFAGILEYMFKVPNKEDSVFWKPFITHNVPSSFPDSVTEWGGYDIVIIKNPYACWIDMTQAQADSIKVLYNVLLDSLVAHPEINFCMAFGTPLHFSEVGDSSIAKITYDLATWFSSDSFFTHTNHGLYPNVWKVDFYRSLCEMGDTLNKYCLDTFYWDGASGSHLSHDGKDVAQDSLYEIIRTITGDILLQEQFDCFGSYNNRPNITSDSLPLYLNSYDSVSFVGDSVNSATELFSISGDACVFINMDGVKLVYSSGGGNNNASIYIGSNANKVILYKGDIIYGGIDIGYANDGIEIASAYNVLIDTVNITVGGTDVHCLDEVGGGSVWNLHFRGGIWENTCMRFTSRHQRDGANTRMYQAYTSTMSNEGFLYHHLFNGIRIKSHAQGICAGGYGGSNKSLTFIINCTFSAASYNLNGSYANPYQVIANFLGPGSEIAYNYIFSDSQYAGSRGIDVEQSVGSPDNPIRVHDNVINIHEGPMLDGGSDYNPDGNVQAGRMRFGNEHVYWENNDVTITLDNDGSTTYIGKGGYCFRFSEVHSDNEGQNAGDSSKIRFNTFEAINLDEGCEGYPFVLEKDPDTGWTGLDFDYSSCVGLEIYGNIFKSNYRMTELGGSNGMASGAVLDSCIFEKTANPLSTYHTYRVGYMSAITHNSGATIRDGIYVGGATEDDVLFGLGDHNLHIERDVIVHVKYNDGNPVENAAIYGFNNYYPVTSDIIFSGLSNENGLDTFLVKYMFMSTSGDSTFNDFIIEAILGVDTTIDTVTISASNDSFVIVIDEASGQIAHYVTAVDTTTTSVYVKDVYTGETGPIVYTKVYYNTSNNIATADSTITKNVNIGNPDSTNVTGLSINTQYWFWYAIYDDSGWDTSSVITVTTFDNVVHSLSVIDTTISTFTVENNYTGNVVDSCWLYYDTVNNILGASFVSDFTALGAPDTLQAVGLASNTKHYFWWVLNDSYFGLDTSAVDSVITEEDVTPPSIVKRFKWRK